MATANIVLRMKKSRDGSYPLCIRITKDRRSSFIHLGKSIRVEDWDSIKQKVKKSHPNAASLNVFLSSKLADANNKLLEVETHKTDVSATSVKKTIKRSAGTTFFKQAEVYIEDLKSAGKYNRVSADQPRINRFREFLKGQDIAFTDISVYLLEKFRTYLLTTRSIKERTAINHLVVIRSVFSQAIKEGGIDKKHYPFGKGQYIIKFPDSHKIGLSIDDLKKLETLVLEMPSYLNHVRNLWLFAFYFAGMRISDVLRLRWSDFTDNRLHYSMGKNLKGGSLKVPDMAIKILEQYLPSKRSSDDLVFPELKTVKNLDDKYKVQERIAYAVSTINKGLKRLAKVAEINKSVSMHLGRHTFGQLSGDKIPVQMLQKLYRHSSITTTIGYQSNFIHKDADEALNAVINF